MNWNDGSTSCDKTREAIADAVMSRRSVADDPDAQGHIVTCEACEAYLANCESMWTKLGELPTPVTQADARAKFDAALRREPRTLVVERRSSYVWRFAALAAGLLVAVLLGYRVGSRGAGTSSPVVAAADSTPQFLILLYDTHESNAGLTPAKLDGVIAEYSAWARGLATAGHLVSAEKLADTPSDWFGGPVSTGAGERIGGFFLIRARDLAEARRIAADCPHLKHGGRVELRPIHQT